MAHTGRWLAAVVAVGGLFLLHGMTADHSLPMPMAVGQVQVASAPLHDATAFERAHGGHAGMIGGGDAAIVVAAASSTAVATVADESVAAHPPRPTRHVHDTAGVCLALLAAIILLQVVRRRFRCNGHRTVVRDAAYVTWKATLKHPPWARDPSPTRLCISRT